MSQPSTINAKAHSPIHFAEDANRTASAPQPLVACSGELGIEAGVSEITAAVSPPAALAAATAGSVPVARPTAPPVARAVPVTQPASLSDAHPGRANTTRRMIAPRRVARVRRLVFIRDSMNSSRPLYGSITLAHSLL